MKKLLVLLITLIIFILPINIKAYEATIIDNCGTFTSEGINELQNYLDNKVKDLDIDIVVLFDDEYTDNIQEHAKNYFLSLGYEYGVIYELNFNIREYSIMYINNSANIDSMVNDILEEIYVPIEKGDYYNSVKLFADRIYDIYYDEIYTDNNKQEVAPKSFKDKAIEALIPSLILSSIITFVTLLVLYNQLKTVHKKDDAYDYKENTSFNIARSGDIYLYTTTSRVRINTNNNNGSSGFSSSSHGSFSGGGSHKF